MDIAISHRGHGDNVKVKGICKTQCLKVHEAKGSQNGNTDEDKQKDAQSSFDFNHGASQKTRGWEGVAAYIFNFLKKQTGVFLKFCIE